MSLFLSHLSKQYPDNRILLFCDGVACHKSGGLHVPDNICLFFIPPQEMVVDRLSDTICTLSSKIVFYITARS